MAIKNRYEYLSGILEALDVEHTEAEVHNNEVWRSKVLDGMGVEHTYDDINQTDLWRAKVVEGINAMAGGGGSSDFSTATVDIIYDINVPDYISFSGCCAFDNNELYDGAPACSYADSGINETFKPTTLKIILYKGLSWFQITNFGSNVHLEVTGNAELDTDFVTITGNCTFRFY